MTTVETAKIMLLQSGAAWVLWFLAGLSASTLVVGVERWIYVRRRVTPDIEGLARQLALPLSKGDWAQAQQFLRAKPSAAGEIAAAGVDLASWGPGAAPLLCQRPTANADPLSRGAALFTQQKQR